MPDDHGKPKDAPRRPEGWDEDLDWGDELAAEPDPANDTELWATQDGEDALDWDDALLEQPASPDDLEWEETEVGDWDEELDWEEEQAPVPDPELPLLELEHELVVVGWSAEASFPDWDGTVVPVHCSTDVATSSFAVSFHVAGRSAVVELDGTARNLPLVEATGELVVGITLKLAGVVFTVPVRLRATSGEPSLELGRDALAGRFLVDAARQGAPGQH